MSPPSRGRKRWLSVPKKRSPLANPRKPKRRRKPPACWPEDEGRRAGFSSFSRIAGIDEAGRGPWAGPVVAAAVVLPSRKPLAVYVDDSKRLTAAQRSRAFACILENADVGFGIVCAEFIDRRNILAATFEAMRLAVDDLENPVDCALVDGHLAPPFSVPAHPIIRGDQRSYVIACASIMAKVLRDSLMRFYHELDGRYDFHLHKGYGTALHRRRLEAFGPSVFHRRSFEPIRRLLQPTQPAVADEPVRAPNAEAVAGQPQ